jgi:2-methylcitrate dehydratase PrpD
MFLTRKLVRVLNERWKQGLPADITAKMHLHIADTIGIALAARRGPPVANQCLQGMRAGGASGDCTVIGSSSKLPPGSAALVNSALAHALDFDDIHDEARLHPTPVVLPAALAAGEIADSNVERIVAAVALGNEMTCRLGYMWAPKGEGPGSDWAFTQVFGVWGACYATCLVLGLSEDEMVAALGLAYQQTAGGKEYAFGIGATSRSMYPGFAAMAGVNAALLARAGVIGPESALDGAAGAFHIYLGCKPKQAQIDLLLDDSAWIFRATEVKPWPSCRLSHPYVAAALAVRDQIGSARIKRVVAAVNASAAKLCRPLEQRRKPETLQDAKYSIPFMIAYTLQHGTPDINTLSDGVQRDVDTLALTQRVEIVETLPDRPGHPPAEIVVETAEKSVKSPPELKFQMTPAEVRTKFLSCMDFVGLKEHANSLWDRLVERGGREKASALLRSIPEVRVG